MGYIQEVSNNAKLFLFPCKTWYEIPDYGVGVATIGGFCL
jgi:hypothetical protein